MPAVRRGGPMTLHLRPCPNCLGARLSAAPVVSHSMLAQASRICAASLIVLSAACGPELPKKPTKDVSDTVSGLSAAFVEMEKAYVASAVDFWVVRVVDSGQRVGKTEGCFKAEEIKGEVVPEIDASLKVSAQTNAGSLNSKWEQYAKELHEALRHCALQSFEQNPRPAKAPLISGLAEEDSYANINTEFNKQFRALIGALSGYYKSIALAAEGEDIQKEAAAAKAFVKTGSAVLGKAASVFAMGADIGPILEAIGNLAVALRTAAKEAERYDAIESALEAVPRETMEDVEDALGLSVVFLQANVINDILVGRVDQQITIFNAWDPQDRSGSNERLRAAMAGINDAREAAPSVLPTGISQLAELHQNLTADIKKRDGSFMATFERLVAIAEAAGAVEEAAKKLREAKN